MKQPGSLQGLVRTGAGLALAGAGGVALALSFPPYGWWPLVFVAMVPVLVAVHLVLPPRLAGIGLGLAMGGFFWLYMGDMFPGVDGWRWLPLIIGVVATIAGYRERAFHTATGYRFFIPLTAAVWVGVELIRGLIPLIGTWGFLGYALHRQVWLIQPVSITGIYGLSWLIMLVNGALALAVMAVLDRNRHHGLVSPVIARRWCLAVGAVLAVWMAVSLGLLPEPADGIPVAAVQPDRVESADELLGLMRSAAADGARLIVLPEGLLRFDPQLEGADRFRELAAELDAYLVLGYVVQERGGMRNEATVVSPDRGFLGVYGKDHPVLIAGETSITGGAYPVFDTALGPVGVVICYDIDFTDSTRNVARAGARLIAVPSADWPEVAETHYTHLVFRAVENRVAMIKADTAHGSVIVDQAGRIVASAVTVHRSQAVVVGRVQPGFGDSPAARLGDGPGWLGFAGLLVLIGGDAVLGMRVRLGRRSRDRTTGRQ